MGQYGHASASLNVGPAVEPKDPSPLAFCLGQLQEINARMGQLLDEVDDSLVRLSGSMPPSHPSNDKGTIAAAPNGLVAEITEQIGRIIDKVDRLPVIRDRLRNV